MMYEWGVVTEAGRGISRHPSLQGLVYEQMTVHIGRDGVDVGPAFLGWFPEMKMR